MPIWLNKECPWNRLIIVLTIFDGELYKKVLIISNCASNSQMPNKNKIIIHDEKNKDKKDEEKKDEKEKNKKNKEDNEESEEYEEGEEEEDDEGEDEEMEQVDSIIEKLLSVKG